MGNGVPNQYPFQHRQGGIGVVDYGFRYHDTMITGPAWHESPPMTVAAYASLRSAANNTQLAFNLQIAASVWGTFFNANPGIDMVQARLGVQALQ